MFEHRKKKLNPKIFLTQKRMFHVSTFLSFIFLVQAFPMKHLHDDLSTWDRNLLLDDIIFSNELKPQSRSGLVENNNRWPNKELIYQLDPKFSAAEEQIIYNGMNMISAKTCITFREKTTKEHDYVYIKRGEPNSGCSSYVGRIGGEQKLNLQAPHFAGAHCLHVGTVAHELIHALGFFHEQSRSDRDDWVTINWANIKPHALHNFKKYPDTMVKSFGVPYDFSSIMHYYEYAFALDYSQPTIYPKGSNGRLGGRVLTPYDVEKLEKMYDC